MQKMTDPRYVLELRIGYLAGQQDGVLRIDDGIFFAVHDDRLAFDFAYIHRFGQFTVGKTNKPWRWNLSNPSWLMY